MLTVSALAGVLMLAGCSRSGVKSPSTETPRDFAVEISGTDGLPLDLLVIVKPQAGSITKAVDEQVTVPYKREFKGVAWGVWVDAPYKGQDGEYTLRIGGSTASGIVKQGSKDQSCLHNL